MNSLDWFKALDEAAKAELKRKLYLMSDDPVISRLRTVLDDKIRERVTQEISFDVSAWSEKQAFNIGYIKALQYVTQLLTMKDRT